MLIAANLTQDFTITEEPFTEALASQPDFVGLYTSLTIYCPAVTGKKNGIWGVLCMDKEGKFAPTSFLAAGNGVAAAVKGMAAEFGKPEPANTRCLQIRPYWGLDQFGFIVRGGRVIAAEQPKVA